MAQEAVLLGIRLTKEAEARLERHAHSVGRGKSVVARDWILERLEQEAVDSDTRRAAELTKPTAANDDAWIDAGTAWLRALDAEDGGTDWVPEGPLA